MALSDYYRPAEYQIRQVAKCDTCGREDEYDSYQQVDGVRCHCGAGVLKVIGEIYPASASDWDEEKGDDGEWHRRRW